MKKILVTGSSGLVGSEVCVHFHDLGYQVYGIDNNQRAFFFGPSGDTRWNQKRLQDRLTHFSHHELDIRERSALLTLVKRIQPDVIVHTAAQPSHDKAAVIPFQNQNNNSPIIKAMN